MRISDWSSDVCSSDLMTVVRNEMESGENNPFRVLMQKMQATAYQWHNYGKSTIGARSDVENVDVAQLRAFYHQYYQPDNAVLIVAGKRSEEHTSDPVTNAHLVCRLLLEKKKIKQQSNNNYHNECTEKIMIHESESN